MARGHAENLGTRARGHSNIEVTRARRNFGHEGTRRLKGTQGTRFNRLLEVIACSIEVIEVNNNIKICAFIAVKLTICYCEYNFVCKLQYDHNFATKVTDLLPKLLLLTFTDTFGRL